MDRIIRTCSGVFVASLLLGAPLAAKDSDGGTESDLYWQAQRAELQGNAVEALKSYNRLLAKLPQSDVAVDRLFETAVRQGDFASAVKAARAQQLAESGNAALPLIFFVEAWRRKDWAAASQATVWLDERSVFTFMVPILNAWIDVAKGKAATIPAATLRENGLLAYYANDQLIYLDFANGNTRSAQKRLSVFPGFGDDYARQMAMTAAEHMGQNGEADYANSLLRHIGAEPISFGGKAAAFTGEHALPSLFARLSEQLNEQNARDQALFFARMAHWIAPDNAYGRMVLARQLASLEKTKDALVLLDGVSVNRPQWSWALNEKARILSAANRSGEALQLIRTARLSRPDAMDLIMLEAQQLESAGKTADAVPLYSRLVKQASEQEGYNGRLLTYLLLLAQAQDSLGDWSSAKARLEQALKQNGENPQLLNSLGYGLLERREDMKRGLELVAKAHRLAPDSAAITDSLGWGHYLNGNVDLAVPLLEKAVEGAINDVTINEHMGDAYWHSGRIVDARYAWRAALLQAEGVPAKRIAAKIDLGWTEENAAP